MGRWIAVGKAPGWDNPERFSAELKSTEKWRIDARTSITTVCTPPTAQSSDESAKTW